MTPQSDSVQVREVTDPRDPAIAAFGPLQRGVYYEPSSLIPAEAIGRLIASAGARENFFVVAEQNGVLLGGALFHYLRAAGSGFSSFMGVARAARGLGIARRLHDARFDVLRRAAGGSMSGVFIDVVNPARLDADELAREQAVGSDPRVRRQVFGHLGFRQLDVRYEQPVGGPNGGPVTNLDLLFCPDGAPLEEIPTALASSTMQAYWSGWLGVDRAAHFANQLATRAGGPVIRLIAPD